MRLGLRVTTRPKAELSSHRAIRAKSADRAKFPQKFRASVHLKLKGCGTHIEHILSVHDLFRRVAFAAAGNGGRKDVDPKTVRTTALHPRAPERNRRATF